VIWFKFTYTSLVWYWDKTKAFDLWRPTTLSSSSYRWNVH